MFQVGKILCTRSLSYDLRMHVSEIDQEISKDFRGRVVSGLIEHELRYLLEIVPGVFLPGMPEGCLSK